MGGFLWCYHSNETSLKALSDGAICFSASWKWKLEIFAEWLWLWPTFGSERVKYLIWRFSNLNFHIYRVKDVSQVLEEKLPQNESKGKVCASYLWVSFFCQICTLVSLSKNQFFCFSFSSLLLSYLWVAKKDASERAVALRRWNI